MKRILVTFVAGICCVSCSKYTTSTSSLNLPMSANAGLKGKHDRLPAIMQRQILNAVDAGDGDYEVRVLREQLAKDEENLSVRLGLADLYEKRGFPELALEHYRFASGKFPHSDDVQLRMSKSLSRLGQNREAAERLDAYLRIHPSAAAALPSMLGILWDREKQYARGEVAHRRALDLDPRQEALHSNLGYNFYLQGRTDEAVAELRRALELNPKSEFAKNNLGLALAAAPERTELALAHYRSQGGDEAVAHNNVGAALLQQGRTAEARAEFEKALAYRMDLPEIWNNLKHVAAIDGKPIVLAAAQPKPLSGLRRLSNGLKRAFVTEETIRSNTRRGAGMETGGR